MNYIYLLLAGVFEIGWMVGLRQLDDHRTGFPWIIVFFGSVLCSIGFLEEAVKTIPIGTAYMVFTAIGTLGTTVVGIWFFHEPIHWIRLVFMSTTLISILGLTYYSNV